VQKEDEQFAAFIGIDWADRKHDVCLAAARSEQREGSVIEHRPAVIREWAAALRERFPEGRIAVCLELTQGPIVSALLEHDFFVLFPVQPATLARYRNALPRAVPRTIQPTRSLRSSCCSVIATSSRRSSPRAFRCARCAVWLKRAASWSTIASDSPIG